MAIERCRRYLGTFTPLFLVSDCQTRLEMLKSAANPPWSKVSRRLWKSLRDFYGANIGRYRIPPGICPACESERTSETHHIIPLDYGGINDLLNMVKIGFKCHNAIHPWMEK